MADELDSAASNLEPLDERECFELLSSKDLGRVGITVGDHPEIFPVNFALDGNSILFRSAEGTKLSHSEGQIVCFEVDDADPDNLLGWSVLLVGRAREIKNQLELTEAILKRVAPWAQGRKSHWVRIEADSVTGRRIV